MGRSVKLQAGLLAAVSSQGLGGVHTFVNISATARRTFVDPGSYRLRKKFRNGSRTLLTLEGVQESAYFGMGPGVCCVGKEYRTPLLREGLILQNVSLRRPLGKRQCSTLTTLSAIRKATGEG
jgi:hypothetical protein